MEAEKTVMTDDEVKEELRKYNIPEVYVDDGTCRHLTNQVGNIIAVVRKAQAEITWEIALKKERKLRYLLWATHFCSGKYCDDGEIQCGAYLLPIDFLRDTPEDIETNMILHNLQRVEALKQRDRPEL